MSRISEKSLKRVEGTAVIYAPGYHSAIEWEEMSLYGQYVLDHAQAR